MNEDAQNECSDSGTSKAHDGSSDSNKEDTHPIGEAITDQVGRLCDLRQNILRSMGYTAECFLKETKKCRAVLEENIPSLDKAVGREQVTIMNNLIEADEQLERLARSDALRLFATGHFLTLFAMFDGFTGNLLTTIYERKPELYNGLERSMPISEMLTYASLEDIKQIVLASEIEAFRRKSYIEQFETLETRFGLSLRKFANWPKFVECAQRRNLFAHCDGYVSAQYISVCRAHGCELHEDVKLGHRLSIGAEYMINSCNLLIEVGLKLGQTLWRKILPDEIAEADKQLVSTQYDFLRRYDWLSACMAGEFALSLPRHSSEALRTIMTINFIIALNEGGQKDRARALLDSREWESLSYDFRLAERVLREDYEGARALMIKIGKSADYVNENAYHIWPLFRHFRETQQFLSAYREIYGYDFAAKVKETAQKSQAEAESQVVRQEEELASPEKDVSPKEAPESRTEIAIDNTPS